jgi:hypothetical protein
LGWVPFLAALITKEMGKRPAQAVGEAEFCTDIFNYYADNGPGLIADKPLPGHDTARVDHQVRAYPWPEAGADASPVAFHPGLRNRSSSSGGRIPMARIPASTKAA